MRNNDIANLTIVEGHDGLIVVGGATARRRAEAAAQGMALFRVPKVRAGWGYRQRPLGGPGSAGLTPWDLR